MNELKICKKCSKCNIPKDITEFPKNGDYIKNICKECIKIYKINWDKKNPNYQTDYTKVWREDNQDKIKVNHTKDYQDNKEQYLNDKKVYYKDNKEIVVKRVMDYRIKKLKTDPFFRLKENIRGLIRNAFNRKFSIKSKKTVEILGCTFEEFKIYLEKQFDEHMNWSNQNLYWVLDHIKPVALAKNEKELFELNHYTNFQPLEKMTNIIKGKKY